MAKKKKRGGGGGKRSPLRALVAAALGAAAGAIGGYVASTQGVAPGTVALGATALGLGGAALTKGDLRNFLVGAGSVGIGSAAIGWYRKGEAERQKKALAARTGGAQSTVSETRQGEDDQLAAERLRRAGAPMGDRNWSAVRRSA